ncbi:hypothetical protein G4O51_03765 [Candidatus Bathyarchaeota archaeon A05DMB-2]|nr:hypothetical protein [Candidatus Bathyarchaeota archaeon A05DMB-2]
MTKTFLPWKKPLPIRDMPVEKKALLAAIFISLLFLIAITEVVFVRLAQANPYTRYDVKHVSPPEGAIPLVISVLSPNDNAVYNVNDIALTFTVSAHNTDIKAISNVSFTASWLQEKTVVYNYNPVSPDFCSYNETFWDLPDGEYSIVITAIGDGSYVEERVPYIEGTIYHFDMITVAVVNFTIATSPKVSILSPKNETYSSLAVPLNFTVNKLFSKISYVLDYRENITIGGNVTLTSLSNGVHNITVYAWDAAGNGGSSETVTFTVAGSESFSAMFVPAVSVASLAAVVVGLLIYRRKHRQVVPQT